MKKPNFFLVGCGRSGTTSLFEALKQHPEFFGPFVKGSDFFANYPNEAYPEFWKNEKKYLGLFRGVKDEKIIGDASHYFHIKEAPARIKKFNPDAKIMIILRNPFDLLKSYYNLEEFPKVDNLEDSFLKSNRVVNELLGNIEYVENVKRWNKNFGKKKVYIMILEEFRKDPKKEFKKICKFLDINDGFVPSFKVHNVSRKLKNKWLVKFIEIFPTSLKRFIKSVFSKVLLDKIRNFVSKFTTKDIKKTPINPKLRIQFKKKLEKEIIMTEKLIDRKINMWGRNSLSRGNYNG